MTLTFVGDLFLPAVCPSVNLALGIPAISLNASLTGSLALNASIAITPPTVALYLSALAELQTQMKLGITFGAPDVSFTISDTIALNVSLNASFSLLVSLEALLSLSLPTGLGAGLYAFTYEGTGTGLGAAVTSICGTTWPDGSSGSCTGIVLGAVSTVAQTVVPQYLDGLTFASGIQVGVKIASLAGMSKLTASATVQGDAAISAQIAASASLSASVSVQLPTLAADLLALANFYANLEAQLSLAPPAIQAAVSANAKLAASISANFGAMASLGAALSVGASLYCYTYSGSAPGYGTALTSALATTWGDGVTSSAGPCVAVVMAALDVVSAGAMGAFFGGV